MKRIACLAICSLLATFLVPASVPLDPAQSGSQSAFVEDCVKSRVADLDLPAGYSVISVDTIVHGDDDVMISVLLCPIPSAWGSCTIALFTIDTNSKTCG